MDARMVSLRRLRLDARAPRHAFVAACVAVVVGELLGATDRSAVQADPVVVAKDERRADVEGIAQIFARRFLVDRGDRDGAVASLAQLGLPEETAAGVRPNPEMRAATTAVVDSDPAGPGRRAVTVAVTGAEDTTLLRVVVVRGRDGRFSVPQPPSITTAPATARTAVRPPEVEVDDRPLRAAAARVVRHYLAGKADELSADLAAGVVVQPPETPFRLSSVLSTTWVARSRRVAVEVLARASRGQQLSLRYELSVVRVSGRWLVTGVNTPTPDREVTP